MSNITSEITENKLQKPAYVIREVYEGENAHETFEIELDKALYAKVSYIIIEPSRLGDETGRWITVGNCLHQTAVITGLASIGSGLIWAQRPLITTPLCVISLFCTGLYTISWNYDPCVQYQVLRGQKKLAEVPNIEEFSTPVVLVYTSNKRSKYLHRSVTILAAAFCAWRLYNSYK